MLECGGDFISGFRDLITVRKILTRIPNQSSKSLSKISDGNGPDIFKKQLIFEADNFSLRRDGNIIILFYKDETLREFDEPTICRNENINSPISKCPKCAPCPECRICAEPEPCPDCAKCQECAEKETKDKSYKDTIRKMIITDWASSKLPQMGIKILYQQFNH